MEPFRIFIVEDDPWYGEVLEYHLSLNPDYVITRCASGRECLANLHLKPDVICLDYSLPDMTGAAIMKEIRSLMPQAQVVVISAQQDVGIAVNLLKEGAYDYIVKDAEAKDRLWSAIVKIRENASLRQEIEELKEQISQKYDFSNSMKGGSPVMQQVFALIGKATRTNITVIIRGETGTGKELVAKAVHYHSNRKKKPFVAVNVAAIPADLVESELFGYEKGAFTGAVARKAGKLEESSGGTLFLDEIGEMSLAMQAKLLRVLQERELTRLGGSEVVKLDFRLIIASHKDLGEEVRKGNFREDLYYRMAGLPIVLPPLRERGNDTLILAKFFADDFCKTNKMPLLQISQQAREKLLAHSFPGNVRELKAAIELACVMSAGDEIRASDISFHTSGSVAALPTEMTLKEINRLVIAEALKKNNNNIMLTASKLDIGKSTIYNMIKSGEITPGE